MYKKLEPQSALNPGYSNTPLKSGEVTLAWESGMPSCSTEKSSTKSFAPRSYPHTPEQIAEEIRVDEEGRLFYIKYKKGRKMNRPVGYTRSDGYMEIRIDCQSYLAHTLAWALYYNAWPEIGKTIDHIDGDRSNNKKDNLRCIFSGENHRCLHNSSSMTGIKNVRYHSRLGKYSAYTTIKGKYIHLGMYYTITAARNAVKDAEKLYFPALMGIK